MVEQIIADDTGVNIQLASVVILCEPTVKVVYRKSNTKL